jgi:hypothetical protein
MTTGLASSSHSDGLSRIRRVAITIVLGLISSCATTRCVASRDVTAYFEGNGDTQDALARTVAGAILARPSHEALVYETGVTRFDCQASVAVYQMAILGLGQIILAHPEKRPDYLPAMRHAAELMLRPETMRYARQAYGGDALSATDGRAYLGYVNLALAMLRLVDPDTSFGPLNDRLTNGFVAQLDASPHGMVETYPNETWPPDVAAVVGSIGLHAVATHLDRSAMLRRWATRFEACALDASGYVVQRVDAACIPLDAPRGTGTAIASYFLAFANRDLSHRLETALHGPSILGFGGVSEYAPKHAGKGDVNAGPMLFNISVGATGFAIGASRANGDEDAFARFVRSANLFGVPTTVAGNRSYAFGGLLGNALMLAMLTARAP